MARVYAAIASVYRWARKCAFPVCKKSPLGTPAAGGAAGANPAVCSPLSLVSSLRRRSISCKAASYLRWSSSYALFGRVAARGLETYRSIQTTRKARLRLILARSTYKQITRASTHCVKRWESPKDTTKQHGGGFEIAHQLTLGILHHV